MINNEIVITGGLGFIGSNFAKYLDTKVKNYKIIIVTNQAGIGKGYFSVYDFQKLMRYMKNLFLKDGTIIHITQKLM